jgi:hypothetical protein
MSVVLTADGLHPVFELKLLFLDGHFFDLFGFREVVSGGELAQAVVKVVVPGGEIFELLVHTHGAPP